MAYDVEAVANQFLDLAARDGETLDPMKIQKLVYLAHGWFLALYNQPLIKQRVAAWRYGPVVETLYSKFKKYGAQPITEKLDPPEDSSELSGDFLGVVQAVWEKYHRFSAIQLSMDTHKPGYAWDLTRSTMGPFDSPTISNALIRDEFLRRKQQKAS